MKGTELPAAKPGPPSLSAEALPRPDEVGAILPRKRRGGASKFNRISLGMPRKNVPDGHRKRADQGRTERVEGRRKCS